LAGAGGAVVVVEALDAATRHGFTLRLIAATRGVVVALCVAAAPALQERGTQALGAVTKRVDRTVRRRRARRIARRGLPGRHTAATTADLVDSAVGVDHAQLQPFVDAGTR
jgi:hypothetical protein